MSPHGLDPAVADLLGFLDRSPTPYHAVAEVARRLEAVGFHELSERDPWQLAEGDARYVIRGGGSILAFQVGQAPPAEAGFRIVGAHTDSPNLRLKPLADGTSQGYRQLAVETYGGVLLHTWLDRDLSLAGRVTFARDGALETALVDFARPLLRVPNLAIHLNREIASDGLKLNAQQHAVPVLGLEDGPPLPSLLATELAAAGTDVRPEDLRGFDLMTYDSQAAGLAGSRGEFVLSGRLDNLASCHAAVRALAQAVERGETPAETRMVVLYDHEEVGSQSATGAGGPLLTETLARVASAIKDEGAEGAARASARSLLVSADMAHAVHPNYADRHDPAHLPRIGGGPVIKTHASQAYASDATSAGLFAELCRAQGLVPQHFVSRSDLRCGSTIGPISAARAGIRTVDVGSPMLSMHSCREMAGAADVGPMIDVLGAFLRGEGRLA